MKSKILISFTSLCCVQLRLCTSVWYVLPFVVLRPVGPYERKTETKVGCPCASQTLWLDDVSNQLHTPAGLAPQNIFSPPSLRPKLTR